MDYQIEESGKEETGYTEESAYFLQGKGQQEPELKPIGDCAYGEIEALDRTLTFVIRNATFLPQVVTIFAPDQEPLVNPLGTTVDVQELVGIPSLAPSNTHNYLRRDVLVNNIAIQGMKYIVDSADQFANAIACQRIRATGKLQQYLFQPQNYISPTNMNPAMIDASDFGIVVDGRTWINFPINARFEGQPPRQITVQFTIKKSLDMSQEIFCKPPVQVSVRPRLTGNPVADIQLKKNFYMIEESTRN